MPYVNLLSGGQKFILGESAGEVFDGLFDSSGGQSMLFTRTVPARWPTAVLVLLSCAGGMRAGAEEPDASQRAAAAVSTDRSPLKQFVVSHCLDCHDGATRQGDVALDALLEQDIGRHAEVWERVVRKLAARQMPPPELPRPKEEAYQRTIAWLESALDEAALELRRQ